MSINFRKKKYLLVLIVMLILAVFFQPWQRKKIVLTVKIPNTCEVLELWEKPEISLFSLSTEYSTWLVVRNEKEDPIWHIIDKQYITFKKVSIFLNNDQKQVRVETGEKTENTHLVAEYNLQNKFFIAKSENTVRNTKGWILLTEKTIR